MGESPGLLLSSYAMKLPFSECFFHQFVALIRNFKTRLDEFSPQFTNFRTFLAIAVQKEKRNLQKIIIVKETSAGDFRLVKTEN